MTKAENRPTRDKKRKRVGGGDALTADKREGFARRIVNCTPGNVEDFEASGWKVVQDGGGLGDNRAGDGSQMGGAVSKHVGNGVHAVLMEIEQEFFDEDQRDKLADYRGTMEALESKNEKFNRMRK